MPKYGDAYGTLKLSITASYVICIFQPAWEGALC